MQTVKTPEKGETFTINGRTYKVSDPESLSTERYEILERFDKQFAFGTDFMSFFNVFKEIIELSNENRTGDIAIKAYNAMQAMSNIENGQVYHFELCTLFINYEGEDTRYWSKELAEQKRKDWSDSGIGAMYFFQQAAAFVPGYLQALKEILQSSLRVEM